MAGKNHMQEWKATLVRQQREFIRDCGGDLVGYLANPHYNSLGYLRIVAIYEADVEELRKREADLIEIKQR